MPSRLDKNVSYVQGERKKKKKKFSFYIYVEVVFPT